ncbi:MAG TPA: AMIN domain-containing protein, partial [Burkholderiaceae bacterium]|nr:AMIN domain-containing protein [Burkholderiaceae bacterium]
MTSAIKTSFSAAAWLRGRWAAFALAALTVIGLVPAASAQENAIESVTANQSGSSVVLRIQMREAPKNPPASFSVANPARIALDFPATSNATGKSNFDLTQGDLRSVNVVTVGDRSRLVLNLKSNVQYNTAVEGNTVIVTLSPSASAASGTGGTAPQPPVRFAEGSTSQQHTIREIDFRRGKDNEGRIVVDLSDAQTGVDIRQTGSTIVVDFLRTSLPPNLRRKLDVMDFGTPVNIVNTFQQGENVRMVIEPKGLWEHNAYQSDTQFVVEVKPVREDPNRLTQGTRAGYKGEKLSLNFQNIDVRAVLQVIAD